MDEDACQSRAGTRHRWLYPSPKNFDALVIGYYEDGKLMYAARTRNGFTPASRAELFRKIKPLEITDCPFANLPEKKAGRWGAGLTAAKMAECRWVKPLLVGQFEFVEWTEDAHLRHSRFSLSGKTRRRRTYRENRDNAYLCPKNRCLRASCTNFSQISRKAPGI